MKNLIAIAVLGWLAFSCQQEKTAEQSGPSPIQVLTSADYLVEYENLRLYPIVADQAFIDDNAAVGQYLNLLQAMDNSRFRITEKKPYGRSDDRGAVNALTVQNKTQDTVFLMTGDVVRGGNQDRVLAMDLVVPPRTITDIPVFCVEHGRWTYRQQEGETTESEARNRKIFAFSGYYHVASNDLRKTIKQTGDQQAVWNKVDELTSLHHAKSNTEAYAALEESESFTSRRDAYLSYFRGRFDDKKGVVGVVAVSGNKVLGADVFGHPQLFQKKYESLMHSYITEALSKDQEGDNEVADLERYLNQMILHFTRTDRTDDHYHFKGQLVHFTHL